MAAYAQSSRPAASVTAPKPPSKSGKNKLKRVSIEVLESGFMGRCSYEGTPVRGRDFPAYVPDKEYALADRTAVNDFLDKALGLPKK